MSSCLHHRAHCYCPLVSLSDSLNQILSEYDIVHPVETDANGHVLPTSASSHHQHMGQKSSTSRSRGKRGTLADSLRETLSDQSRGRSYMDIKAGLYYNVSLFGHDLHLRLHPNSRLIAPTATMEWWEESGDRHSQPIGDTGCFYTGQVSNMEDTSVAISNCDGLVGLPLSSSLPSAPLLAIYQATFIYFHFDTFTLSLLITIFSKIPTYHSSLALLFSYSVSVSFLDFPFTQSSLHKFLKQKTQSKH